MQAIHGVRGDHNGAAAHQTVLAHSYGTVVAGIAAKEHGLNADDLILVASPGIPVDHVTDLHLDGVREGYQALHTYAITSPDDWIQQWVQYVGGDHGINPADPLDPVAFGGQILHDDNGSRDEHNGYFDEGTASLARLGRIIAPPA